MPYLECKMLSAYWRQPHKSGWRRCLLASVVVVLVVINVAVIAVAPTFAQTSGGAGGTVGSPGGSGGASSGTGGGANGGFGAFDSGGGGGGAGAGPPFTVGHGLFGGDGGPADGGAAAGNGAFFTGGGGGYGGSVGFANLGAGGGGGGAAGTLISTSGTTTLIANSVGGDGGGGGSAIGVGGGGGGGAGGFGISIAASSVTLNNNQIITGGRGGDGGGGSFGVGGNGGDGGIGVYFVNGGTLNNSGSIFGGAGGAGGGATTPGIAGANSPGVEGANLTIINSGTITGGNGNGLQANAITFTGGANTLTLQTGSGLVGNLEIDGGGIVSFNQSSAQTLSNAITGNGSVIQAGAGELTLTGVNTYSGGTVILSGSTVAGTTTSLQGTITNGGAVIFDQATTGTYSGSITGGGILTKAGIGTLILDGVNTYTGATTVSGGTFEIGDAATPGASITSAVTIGVSGTLSGYGEVTGNIINTAGGALFAGGSSGIIGTLNVTGNYIQGSTSTMVVEVSPTAASKLAVTGNATLNGGNFKVVYDPGTYTTKSYTILTTTGGLTVSTAPTLTVSGAVPVSVVSQDVSYTGFNANLNVVGGSVAAPSNNTVFGESSTVQTSDFYSSDSMVFDHLGDIEAAADVDVVKSSFAATGPMKLAFNGTQLAQFGNKSPGNHYGAWARGIGNWTSARGQGSSPAYSSSAGGMLGGIDTAIADDIVAGVAAGFSHTDITQADGTTGAIDTPRVMLYGSYTPMPSLSFNAIAGLAYERINTSRPVTALGSIATEGHNGFEENLALQGAYSIPFDEFSIIPNAGLQYVHHTENKFSESGASGFNLSSGSTHIDSFQPIVGIIVVRPFVTDGGVHITVEGKVSYNRELLSTNRNEVLTTASGALSPATSVTPARNTLALGPAVTVQANDILQLYVDYKATLGLGKSTGHTVFAGARYDF
jgi:outer membrane autotransporter protein